MFFLVLLCLLAPACPSSLYPAVCNEFRMVDIKAEKANLYVFLVQECINV